MEKIISSYECMFIINCASGDDAAKATVEKFTSTITANAEIVEVAEWGRRRLAYPIDDMNEGYYILFTFKSEGAFPAELQRLANIDESVMRAALSHGWGMTGSKYEPAHIMEKILFAADELTGLIGAAAMMRPSKSVCDMEVSSLKKKFKDKGQKIQSFADMREGDYVVHENSGVGRYTGIDQLTVNGVKKDYMKVVYQGGDNLYVPIDQMDKIQKYIGSDAEKVKLNKIGSSEWSKAKAKVKKEIEEMTKDLVELYAKREKVKGYKFSKDTPWQGEFESLFPHQETDDQLKAIEDTKKDMESDKVMDRLICGDVGFGKTEVAIRAVFKACMDQKQVAYLVPTTILANQQYESFKKTFR